MKFQFLVRWAFLKYQSCKSTIHRFCQLSSNRLQKKFLSYFLSNFNKKRIILPQTSVSSFVLFLYNTVKERILIIDDEVDFCGIMKNYFLRKNYEAEVAYTIYDGVTLLNRMQPEILFLDNNLPDGDGWEIVERVVEIIPRIRIYLISAHRDKSSYKGVSQNIFVWEKPISLQMLNDVF